MSTQIECTKCNEVISLEANLVELPYVCNDCVAADQFYEDITPKAVKVAVERLDEYPTLTELVSKEELSHAAHAGLDEADASVENTTLLIEDLEEQVAAQKELNDQANLLIEDMSKQLTEDAATIGDNERLIHGLEIWIEELNKTILVESDRYLALRRSTDQFADNMMGLADEWDAERDDLEHKLSIEKMANQNNERRVTLVKEALDQANTEIKGLTVSNKEWRDRLMKVTEEYWALFYSNERLKERGFFARVFNR